MDALTFIHVDTYMNTFIFPFLQQERTIYMATHGLVVRNKKKNNKIKLKKKKKYMLDYISIQNEGL